MAGTGSAGASQLRRRESSVHLAPKPSRAMAARCLSLRIRIGLWPLLPSRENPVPAGSPLVVAGSPLPLPAHRTQGQNRGSLLRSSRGMTGAHSLHASKRLPRRRSATTTTAIGSISPAERLIVFREIRPVQRAGPTGPRRPRVSRRLRGRQILPPRIIQAAGSTSPPSRAPLRTVGSSPPHGTTGGLRHRGTPPSGSIPRRDITIQPATLTGRRFK